MLPQEFGCFSWQKLSRPICHLVEVSICPWALHSSVTTAVSELTLTECSQFTASSLIAYSALNEFSSHSATEVSDLLSHLPCAHFFWLYQGPPTAHPRNRYAANLELLWPWCSISSHLRSVGLNLAHAHLLIFAISVYCNYSIELGWQKVGRRFSVVFT